MRRYQNQWKNLYTWTNPKAGRYYVRVLTNPETSNSRGSNGFSLRAWTGSSYTTCSTISGSANYSANVPAGARGERHVDLREPQRARPPTFYLAQIDPIHAGKTMRVNLFDAGEGAHEHPDPRPQRQRGDVHWTTPCNPQTPPIGRLQRHDVNSLDVSRLPGTPALFGPQQHEQVQRPVPHPRHPAARQLLDACTAPRSGGRCKYTVGSSPTDRTTWSVNIVGDPVHLLQ